MNNYLSIWIGSTTHKKNIKNTSIIPMVIASLVLFFIAARINITRQIGILGIETNKRMPVMTKSNSFKTL